MDRISPAKRLNWIGAFALLVGVAFGGCSVSRTERFADRVLPVIELPDGAIEIVSDTEEIESPALSPDGRRVAVQVVEYRHRWLPYEVCSIAVSELHEVNHWSPLEIIRWGKHQPYLGRMELPVQPSFDETGEHLLLTHIEFQSGLGIPWISTTRSWVERIPWNGGVAKREIEYRDWHLAPTELLQHARISPDGVWLVFYTRERIRDQGVYLLNRRTGKHYRLCDQRDKHPTWDPTGRRIYFHHVEGGKRRRFDPFARGTERSVLGFFDLRIEQERLLGYERHLMDEMGDEYFYDKHPTEVAGTGLLFFHGRKHPGGKMKLMVRAVTPGSQVYIVKPRLNGKVLKAAKHACSSYRMANLVFVGKVKGERTYRMLLSLTGEAMDLIRSAVLGGRS